MNKQNKQNPSSAVKSAPQVVKKCFVCAKPGHLQAACPRLAQVAPTATRALAAVRPVPTHHVPKTAPVSVGVPRAGREIEHEMRVIAEGSLAPNGRRHHRVEYRGKRRTQHGDCEVYGGTIRVDQLTASAAVPAGSVLAQIDLHWSELGPAAEREISLRQQWRVCKCESDFACETTFIDKDIEGALAMVYSTDSSVVLPGGSAGVTEISSWPNYEPIPLRRARDVRKHMNLALNARPPLQVALNPETGKYDTQGTLYIVAATDVNNSAHLMTFGEWYIHWECEAYTFAPDEDDQGGASTWAYGDAVPAGNSDMAKLTEWYGGREVITAPSFSATGVSFVALRKGTYALKLRCYQETAGVATLSTGSVSYYTVPGLDVPELIDAGPLSSVQVSNTFLGAHTGSGTPESVTGYFTIDSATHVAVATNQRLIVNELAFSCDAGQPFVCTWPTNAGGATYKTYFIITRLSTERITKQAKRAAPNVIVGGRLVVLPKLVRLCAKSIESIESPITDRDIQLITDWIKKFGDRAPGECNLLIDKLHLPIRKVVATTMVLPAVAAVVSWAVATFGPVLAQKAIDWVCDRVDGGNRQPPVKPRRTRRRRDEDDDDDYE